MITRCGKCRQGGALPRFVVPSHCRGGLCRYTEVSRFFAHVETSVSDTQRTNGMTRLSLDYLCMLYYQTPICTYKCTNVASLRNPFTSTPPQISQYHPHGLIWLSICHVQVAAQNFVHKKHVCLGSRDSPRMCRYGRGKGHSRRNPPAGNPYTPGG